MDGKSVVLHRDLHKDPYEVVEASGIHLKLASGLKVIDASGGAAVSCIGHGDARVAEAVTSQMMKLDYCHSLFFSCPQSEELSQSLIATTDGKMSKVFIVNSGELQTKFGALSRPTVMQGPRLWTRLLSSPANTF